MAGIGMDGKDEKELELEKALPVKTRSTLSRRERHQPDRYGFSAPVVKASSKPKNLPHHSQATKPSPNTTAAEEGEVEEEEITHDYVQPKSVEEHSVQQLAPPSQGEGRPHRSRGKRDKQESLPRSKKATSYTYTYGSGSSRSSCKSRQVELTPIQAAMIEERRKLGELQEIQSQIQEEQALDSRAQELDRQAQAALTERERLDRQARAALTERERMSRSLTLQRRLRRVQRELEEARLITSFTGEVTTEHPTALPPQELAPFSMSSRVLDSGEPVDLFSEQEAPFVSPQISGSEPVPVNQPTTSSFQSLPQPVHAVSQSETLHPVQGSHPAVPASSPEHATPSPPSFLHLVRTAPRPAQSQRPSDPVPVIPAPFSLLRPIERTSEGASIMELLVATAFGIPKPRLPYFESGRESDFVLLNMALENLLDIHAHLSEQYKFQVLMDHLRLPTAYKLAKSYMHASTPYTSALAALKAKYGQPRQLVQSEIASILHSPPVRFGDSNAFQDFALSVQSLIGMLRSVDGAGGSELRCGSHVDRLLTKLPFHYRDSFVEHCLNRGILKDGAEQTYTLEDFSAWLQVKARAKSITQQVSVPASMERREPVQKSQGRKVTPTTMYLSNTATVESQPSVQGGRGKGMTILGKPKFQPFCPYCNNNDHFLGTCPKVKEFSPSELRTWIEKNDRCYRCARCHKPDKCTLKKPCNTCHELHLTILHNIARQLATRQQSPENSATADILNVLVRGPCMDETLYIDQLNRSPQVMLKVVPVILINGRERLQTYAILDDGSERTIILTSAASQLQLKGPKEVLNLRTVRHEVIPMSGETISCHISPVSHRKKKIKFPIANAFTAPVLNLAEHSCHASDLQREHSHLRGLPLPDFVHAQPLILIGSDHSHLLVPKEPVRIGPYGGPIAVHTALGWTVQGPSNAFPRSPPSNAQALFTLCDRVSCPATAELMENVERLWRLDSFPHRKEKEVTRSKQDNFCLELLETKTAVKIVGETLRYATPLLRAPNSSRLFSSVYTLLPWLRGTERRLKKDQELIEIYNQEIQKLVDMEYVKEVDPKDDQPGSESWLVPHHVIKQASGKHRLVFNCSFQLHGLSLNCSLLPGPTLGPSLLGVLLRFREHSVAISGDIKSMFHQVHLLPADRPLLRFLWRAMAQATHPKTYEWQVLPFGTTCSPCCAIYALQRHAKEHPESDHEVLNSVLRAFYVDNCLQSFNTSATAKALLDKLRATLSQGGFEIRQWASNDSSVVEHLPPEARSVSTDLWLSQAGVDPQESTLGLRWSCIPDSLGYKHRAAPIQNPTLRLIYRTLASQYDPLGYILPYTTRAKVLVQDLWKIKQGWDDPITSSDLADQWLKWEHELSELSSIRLPRCYVPPCADQSVINRELHVFCDAAERAYGAVAYLRVHDNQNHIHVAFIMARSRVSPKRQLSIPRLELSAALLGAQLANTLRSELTLSLAQTILWSDSTTVLTWLKSESCHYKVFVGTRIAEIQELTDIEDWRYVDSSNNPADALTRGKKLCDLARPNCWTTGPFFLHKPENCWPVAPGVAHPSPLADRTEVKKAALCLNVSAGTSTLPDVSQYQNWSDFIVATEQARTQADKVSTGATAENLILQQAQASCFPDELNALQKGKPLHRQSRLLSLSPELDSDVGLMRVGGRLRRSQDLDPDIIHPIILDPKHPTTQLIIKDYDESLLHPGPERVFGELRRKYWIVGGRPAIRKHQHSCRECQRWKSSPEVPKMADLPPARLRLFKPPFWSTGVDCFGPFVIYQGRRTEKRWGIIFKCLTTRCLHLDLLGSLDVDAFLLALRRFISRRGKPFEIWADRGTNFRAGDRELSKCFQAMEPKLQEHLATQQISFNFNPPGAPHFGGVWEREIRSVKNALRVILGKQTTSEVVLQTVLIEVEGIMNSKPLGYLSSNAADPDPITPNLLLMGRRDASLPQAMFINSKLLGRRKWRHSQILADHFWTRFIRDYLPNLQPRGKWLREVQNLEVGKTVLIFDPQLPRASWPTGRVTTVTTGRDGRVRSVDVQVGSRIYTRPVSRLMVLPEQTEE